MCLLPVWREVPLVLVASSRNTMCHIRKLRGRDELERKIQS